MTLAHWINIFLASSNTLLAILLADRAKEIKRLSTQLKKQRAASTTYREALNHYRSNNK